MSAARLDRINPGLGAALIAAAHLAAPAQDPWWIIGSAALALHGIDPDGVRDIDLLTSAADARMLLDHAGGAASGDGGNERFRSAVYGRIAHGRYDIEVMGDLHYRSEGRWNALLPRTREAVMLADVTLYVPCRAEMVAILRAFGREKDLHRASLLQRANADATASAGVTQGAKRC